MFVWLCMLLHQWRGADGYAHLCVWHWCQIIRQCEVLLDLHTAGFGKLNSYYIRASMSHPVVSRMAILMVSDSLFSLSFSGVACYPDCLLTPSLFMQRPHIIAHSNGPKASLRLEATKAGVPTVQRSSLCPLIATPRTSHSLTLTFFLLHMTGLC